MGVTAGEEPSVARNSLLRAIGFELRVYQGLFSLVSVAGTAMKLSYFLEPRCSILSFAELRGGHGYLLVLLLSPYYLFALHIVSIKTGPRDRPGAGRNEWTSLYGSLPALHSA